MNTEFHAAAQAIAEHFKQAEAARFEPFADTFINPMNNDAVTPNFVGVPLALLRALVDGQASGPSPQSAILKAAFIAGLASLLASHVAQIEINEETKARWLAWLNAEVEAMPEETNVVEVIDSAVALLSSTSTVPAILADALTVAPPPSGVVGVTALVPLGCGAGNSYLLPERHHVGYRKHGAFDPYSGR